MAAADKKRHARIVIFGGAGLVGQNLTLLLEEQGYDLVVIDKHTANLRTLAGLHPNVSTIEADMARPGEWQNACKEAVAAVMLNAQIGGKDATTFERNNIDATRNALDALRRHGVTNLVHVSSSVVKSMARDSYIETKTAQEQMVRESGMPFTILRPTLMFGWFDRKHLGWLARFMKRTPVFPIPGSGRFMRQPLYVRDFCRIVLACIERGADDSEYDITGAEEIDYIDMIREIKTATGARCLIAPIPYGLFRALLRAYAVIDPDPPFTADQLAALATPDRFSLIPWWDIFHVERTPFRAAIDETFSGRHADIALEF